MNSTEEVKERESTDRETRQRPFGIALCLSGGGYRAALFHLGVVRCLHDMGILQEVDTISSVSGGSILSAFLAKRIIELQLADGLRFDDWETQVSRGFHEFVQNDIRTIPFFAHIAWNWASPRWRASHLTRNYRTHLTSKEDSGREITLDELPARPSFKFCSTDLNFGVNWEFSRERVGNFQAGYTTSKDWPLSLAVGASSCFPPVFGPMTIKLDPLIFKKGAYREDDRDKLLSRIQLTDGGVYDNFGLEPVNDNHTTVLISDGGSPFAFGAGRLPIFRHLRYLSVIMNQVAALRKRAFFATISSGSHDGVYCGIKSSGVEVPSDDPYLGYSDKFVTQSISRIRTDLDRFNSSEAKILENHGYFTMHRRITDKAPHLIRNAEYVPSIPYDGLIKESDIAPFMRKSHRRLSISRLLRLD